MLNTEKKETLIALLKDIEPILRENTILVERNEKSSKELEETGIYITSKSSWAEYRSAERDFDLDELVERSGIDVDPSMSTEEIATILKAWTEDDDRSDSNDLERLYGSSWTDSYGMLEGHTDTEVSVEKEIINIVKTDQGEYLEIPFIKYLHSLLLGS
jgi:hypothetical protein